MTSLLSRGIFLTSGRVEIEEREVTESGELGEEERVE